MLAGISGGCSGSIMYTTATSVHGGTYFGGAAPSFGGPRASKVTLTLRPNPDPIHLTRILHLALTLQPEPEPEPKPEPVPESGPNPNPNLNQDGPLQGAEARAAAAAGAAKRVTFTGVASLEELRRSHKQRRSSLAQVPACPLC